jgi:hypothetical protein
MSATTRAVRVLECTANGELRHPGLLSVESGVRLVFTTRPSPGLDLSSLVLWTNCPLSPGDQFRRHTFVCLEGFVESTGDWATYIDVELPGCFEFFLEFDHHEGARGGGPGEPGDEVQVLPDALKHRGPLLRFVVQPVLTVSLSVPRAGASASSLAPHPLLPGIAVLPHEDLEEVRTPFPLEGMTLQTQLTRCLGPIDGWLRHSSLDSALSWAAGVNSGKVRGSAGPASTSAGAPGAAPTLVVSGALAEPIACKYNALHFTPPQVLGGSASCYSLRDQLALDGGMFQGNACVEGVVRSVMAHAGGGSSSSSASAAAAQCAAPCPAHPAQRAAAGGARALSPGGPHAADAAHALPGPH